MLGQLHPDADAPATLDVGHVDDDLEALGVHTSGKGSAHVLEVVDTAQISGEMEPVVGQRLDEGQIARGSDVHHLLPARPRHEAPVQHLGLGCSFRFCLLRHGPSR